MELNYIYTLANEKVRLQFSAMERSLRATGCQLPLRVMPYGGERFELPRLATWWTTPLQEWLHKKGSHPMTAKYQCLTQANYFYTDVDIVFLRNPIPALAPFEGFVAADTEWNKPKWAFTEESEVFLSQRTSLWTRNLFNAGFFACDQALYAESELYAVLDSPTRRRTCLQSIHDEPGLNLLVAESGVPYTNLNLPPQQMESTWAGDYPREFKHLWPEPERKPIFLHWAGSVLDEPLPINALFEEFLTVEEMKQWRVEQAQRIARDKERGRWPLGTRILNRILRRFYPNYYVQPRPISSFGNVIAD